jgi:hypothetical protein
MSRKSCTCSGGPGATPTPPALLPWAGNPPPPEDDACARVSGAWVARRRSVAGDAPVDAPPAEPSVVEPWSSSWELELRFMARTPRMWTTRPPLRGLARPVAGPLTSHWCSTGPEWPEPYCCAASSRLGFGGAGRAVPLRRSPKRLTRLTRRSQVISRAMAQCRSASPERASAPLHEIYGNEPSGPQRWIALAPWTVPSIFRRLSKSFHTRSH